MKIQVIIPCINLWKKYTKDCIESTYAALKFLDENEYRILLIDNASTDETLEEAGKLVSSTFAHMRNEEMWSVSKSWNSGISDAFARGSEYVLVLNNDVLLHKDSIKRLIDRFEVGNKTLGTEKCSMATMMDIRGECLTPTDLYTTDSSSKDNVPEAEHPNFSGFMINRECWEKVGEFDEGFEKAYFEDGDYHYRMKLQGLRAITYPPALFYHYGSRTQNEALDRPIVPGPDFIKNRNYFVGKWGGSPGDEKFTHPFDNPENDLKWVKHVNNS